MSDNHDILKEDLTQAYSYPTGLNQLTTNLEKRIKKERRRKSTLYGSLSVMAASLFFILLVNTSTTFAYALSDIPILNRISQFVLFDESLKSALENDYIQYVGLKEVNGEEALKLPYIIADEQSIILFFQTQEDTLLEDEFYEVRLESFRNRTTGELVSEGYSSSTFLDRDKSPENLGLKHIRVNFVDLILFKNVDINVTLSKMKLNNGDLTPISEESFTFSVTLNDFIEPIVYPIDQDLLVNDIEVTINCMEVYPTTTLIYYKTNNINNDELYLQFKLKEDGIVIDLPETNSYYFSNEVYDEHTIRIEDNFFNQPETRSLILSGYSYISEEDKYIILDGKNKTFSRPIPNVTVDEFTYLGDKIKFTLSSNNPISYTPIMSIENETKTEYLPYSTEQRSDPQSSSFLYSIETSHPIINLKMQPPLTELDNDSIEIPINISIKP